MSIAAIKNTFTSWVAPYLPSSAPAVGSALSFLTALYYRSASLGALSLGSLALRSWTNETHARSEIRNFFERVIASRHDQREPLRAEYASRILPLLNQYGSRNEREMIKLVLQHFSGRYESRAVMCTVTIKRYLPSFKKNGIGDLENAKGFYNSLQSDVNHNTLLLEETCRDLQELRNLIVAAQERISAPQAPIATPRIGVTATPGITISPVIRQLGFTFTADPSSFHQHVHPNKLFVYRQLTQCDANHVWQTPPTRMTFSRYELADKTRIGNERIFQHHPQVTIASGIFPYPASTRDTVEWTANFADEHLFGFCAGGLLAQDELQVAEHPGLMHLRADLASSNRGELRDHEIALVENVQRLGRLSMYGNGFASAPQSTIATNLTRFTHPTLSNIFAIVAPRPSRDLQGQPYQEQDLRALFLRAYTTFVAIKERSAGKRVVIHTGNWGAGAFGGSIKAAALCQLAAARMAGIEEVVCYPVDAEGRTENRQLYEQAMGVLKHLQEQVPNITVSNFLAYLTQNARNLGLFYGVSNGT